MGQIPSDITFFGQSLLTDNDINLCEKLYFRTFITLISITTIIYLIF